MDLVSDSKVDLFVVFVIWFMDIVGQLFLLKLYFRDISFNIVYVVIVEGVVLYLFLGKVQMFVVCLLFVNYYFEVF